MVRMNLKNGKNFCNFYVSIQTPSTVVDVTPGVIEPSFGIGRILYSILEHNFNVREGDEQRNWLSLPPGIAPISCSVLPLSGDPRFDPHLGDIGKSVRQVLHCMLQLVLAPPPIPAILP